MKIFFVVLIGFALISLLRMRRRIALLAEQIRGLRARSLEPVAYRPLTTTELDESLATTMREAEALGVKALGDYVEESGGVGPARPLRFVTDAAGTTFGWIAPFDVRGMKHVVIVLLSHELDAQTVTVRQPPASNLSRAPFVTMQQLPPTASLEETLGKHRAKAGIDSGDRAFIPVHTGEELQHEVARMRDKVIAWRKDQPADDLLDADLRSLLGAQYPKLADAMKRRLV
jgi:hypothetical protein